VLERRPIWAKEHHCRLRHGEPALPEECQPDRNAGDAEREASDRETEPVGHSASWWGLTFDMRGDRKAQPFGHPLDGGVSRLCQEATRSWSAS